jgi:hypothetical protein
MKPLLNNIKEIGFLGAYKNYLFFTSVFLIKTCNSTNITDFDSTIYSDFISTKIADINSTFLNSTNSDFVSTTAGTIPITVAAKEPYQQDCVDITDKVIEILWPHCTNLSFGSGDFGTYSKGREFGFLFFTR